MPDTKRIIGYGTPGLLFLAIALVLILKSRQYFWGLMVLILGAAALLAFRAWGEDWLAKRKAAAKRPPLSSLEAKQAATEAKDMEVEAESSTLLGLWRQVVDAVSSVAKPEKRKPVFGEELAVIEKAIAEGTGNSLDELYSRVAKDLSLLESLIATFEDEHSAIKAHTDAARRREKDVKGLLKEMQAAKKEYLAAVKKEDREKKRMELEQLEARMRKAMGEDVANTERLEAEAGKVSSIIHDIHRRTQKVSRLLPKVKREFIMSGDRGQQYRDMLNRLDGLNRDDAELASQAEAYRTLLYSLRTELSVLREVILGVTNSELTAERLRFQALADAAGREAADAGRLLGRLFRTREALDAKKIALDAEVAAKLKVMDTLSAQRKAWQDDLDSALKAVKADPKLRSEVSLALKRNIDGQGRALSSLMSLLLALSKALKNADSSLGQANEALARMTSKRDSLLKEKNSLEEAKRKAEEQKAAAQRESAKVSKEAEDERRKLKKASEEEAAKIRANVDMMAARLAALKGVFDEASAQQQGIEARQAPLDEQIGEAADAIKQLTAKVAAIKAERDDNVAKLASAEASHKGIVAEKEKFIRDLVTRSNELERERRALLDSIGALDKDSRRLEGLVQHMASDVAGFAELKERALAGIRGFNERLARSDELDAKQKAMIAELEKALQQQEEQYKGRIVFFLSLIATVKERIRNLEVEESSLERSSEAKEEYARRLGEWKSLIEEDIDALRERMREIRRIAEEKRSPADEAEFRRLNAEIEERKREAERLLEESKDNAEAAEKEAAEAGKVRGLLARAKEQLEEAERGHRQLVEELNDTIEQLNKDIDGKQQEIDDKAGRIVQLEAEQAELKAEVENLRVTITSSISIAQRNSILEQELQDIRRMLDDVKRLNELKQGLAEAVKQRLIDLIKERGALQAELKAKEDMMVAESLDADRLREEKAALEQRLHELEEGMRALQERMQPPPEAERLMRDIESVRAEAEDKEAERKSTAAELDAAKRRLEGLGKELASKDEEIAKLRQDVERLGSGLREANRLLEDGRQKAEKADEESRAAARQSTFATAQRKILDKIAEARRFADDDPQKASAAIEEAVRLANTLKQEGLTEAEVFEVDRLIEDAVKIEQWAERRLAAQREPEQLRPTTPALPPEAKMAPKGKEAVPEGDVAVLIPFMCKRIVSEEGRPEEISRIRAKVFQQSTSLLAPTTDVPYIVIDSGKDRMVVGRDDGCDIVLKGDKDDLRVVSRRHFEIVVKGDEYKVVAFPPKMRYPQATALSYARLRRYSKGALELFKPGKPMLLEDGMEFFIDNEEMFCFQFRLMPRAEVLGSQALSWQKLVVEFPPSGKLPPAAVRCGYLEVPSHANIVQVEGKQAKRWNSNIILNKPEVRIGKAGSEEVDSGINIIADENLFVVIDRKPVKCTDRVLPLQMVIRQEGDAYFVEPTRAGSAFLNYKEVRGRQQLSPGDIIHIGDNEPLFFTFRVREFAHAEQVFWNFVDVKFNNMNFDTPLMTTGIGVLYAPRHASLSLIDRKGEARAQEGRKLPLTRYNAVFGAGDDVHVRLACDDLFTDRRARPASAVIEKQHFMVRKDFSHVYSMFAMCKEGVRIIPKGGAEFVLQHGGFYTLRDEDVIKVMDNDEVFLFFRTEEAGLTEKERWHRASIEFKHEGKREDHYKAKRRICGGLLAGLFRRRR